jgi:hypothetical protein
VAADVVYHDHLLEPLLAALLALTSPPAQAEVAAAPAGALWWEPVEGGAAPVWRPPPVLLSYVQRFKRAKRFFKLAAAHFDVSILAPHVARGAAAQQATPATGGGHVVDYDALSWSIPELLRRAQRGAARAPAGSARHAFARPDGGDDAVPLFRALAATYVGYCELLGAAGEAEALAPSSAARAGGAPAPRHGVHTIDSDSGDEWEDAEGFARDFAAQVGGCDAPTGGDTPRATPGLPSGMEDKAQRAARALGVPFAEPSHSYIYLLRRRLPK